MIGKVDHHKVKKKTFLINNQYSTDSKIISNHFNELNELRVLNHMLTHLPFRYGIIFWV